MNKTKSGDPISSAARRILDAMERRRVEPSTQRQLLHRLNVAPQERAAFRKAIARLLKQRRLVRGGGGVLRLPGADSVEGRLQRLGDGQGWLTPDDGGDSIYLDSKQLEGRLSGDRLRVERRTRGRRGKVLELVQSRSRECIGQLEKVGRAYWLLPFEADLGRLRVTPKKRDEGEGGDVVRAKIVRTPEPGSSGRAQILEVIGPLEKRGVDVAVVCSKFGLDTELDRLAVKEAKALPTRVSAADKRERERFDQPAPVTIDGANAKDFDDAIAVRALGQGRFRLWVHIADVAHFVPEGSELDRAARERATSVYFPDRVLPMFPPRLSDDLCSLRPGVDRLVQSAILDLDAEGEIDSCRFADGVIRSQARLTYEQVGHVLDGERKVRGVSEPVHKMLRTANKLRELLEQRRSKRGGLDFDLPRPVVLLDVEGAVTGVKIEARNKAHRLIEECMLIANEAVATYLSQDNAACLFRVHEGPSESKVRPLLKFASTHGIEASKSGKITPKSFSRLIERLGRHAEPRVVQTLALRSMQQARYQPEHGGHFGLALETYCHFTSPIRRYPDLVVHRLLREHRAKGVNKVDPLDLARLGDHCSELERTAEAAERELLHWKKVNFLAGRVGERFEGRITAVLPYGVFVQLEETLVEGLLRVDALGPEPFRHDDARHRLTGRKSGRHFALGEPIQVRIERVDRRLRRIDFSLADQPPTPEIARGKVKRARSVKRR